MEIMKAIIALLEDPVLKEVIHQFQVQILRRSLHTEAVAVAHTTETQLERLVRAVEVVGRIVRELRVRQDKETQVDLDLIRAAEEAVVRVRQVLMPIRVQGATELRSIAIGYCQ